MNKDRIQFDLEQEIMNCWNITKDLDVLFEEIIEGDLTKDQISNVLLGLNQLYEIKFNKLFRTFEVFLKLYYENLEKIENFENNMKEEKCAKMKEQHFNDYTGYIQFQKGSAYSGDKDKNGKLRDWYSLYQSFVNQTSRANYALAVFAHLMKLKIGSNFQKKNAKKL